MNGDAEAEAEAPEPQDAAPEGFAAAPGTTSWVDLGRPNSATSPGPGLFTADPTAGPTAAASPRPAQRGFGGLVLAALLAATGVVGVLDAARLINLGWISSAALVLLLLGAGMVVGGLFGKTTGLVPIGIVLAVPLILLSTIGIPLRGAVGDTRWTPASAAALAPRYQLSAGDADLDLSNVDPGPGRTVTTLAQVGAGDLLVQVPTDVDVIVHAHAGVGHVGDAGDQNSGSSNGIGSTRTFTIPAKGTAQGTIVLNLKAGIGDVDVEAGS